jgi:hypothetical protein
LYSPRFVGGGLFFGPKKNTPAFTKCENGHGKEHKPGTAALTGNTSTILAVNHPGTRDKLNRNIRFSTRNARELPLY